MRLRPIPDLLEIATVMLSIKVHKGRRLIRMNPDLAENANVDRAHQLLAEDVKAVCWRC